MNHRTTVSNLAAIALAASTAASSLAATQAYWRHEGTVGSTIPAGENTVPDSSGNGNNMRTFDPTFTSATYSDSVSPLPLRSGLPNTSSLDFGPGGDDAGLNDDNYTTPAKPISGMLFSAMTVELAFSMDTIGGFQALFGKDGKPLGDAPGEDDSPVPPLKIMVRGDDFPNAVPNQLFVEWIDGGGKLLSDIHFLSSKFTVEANKWYHVAFTLNATNSELWIATDTGPYTLVDSGTGDYKNPDFDEVLVQEPLGFSIGRGMFANNVTDWADAKIDEVRVSDTVLTPDQFLFLAGPQHITGDTNNDGVVDLSDLNNVLNNFGSHVTGNPGDENHDNVVDLSDLNNVLNNFGAHAAAGALAVPEPTCLAACGLAVTALAARRRRTA